MSRLKSKGFLLAAIVLCGFITALSQQPDQPLQKQYDAKVQQMIADIVEIKRGGAANADKRAKDSFSPLANSDVFALAIALAITPHEAYVAKIEEARVDKQVAATAPTSSLTSLLSKASVPGILGLAVENGALQKEVNGTTYTFRGNFIGIIKALGDKGFFKSYDDDDPTTRFLRRFSFAASFDTSRGQQAGTFTGSNQQLSSYSFHADLYNKRDPRNSSYTTKWSDLISKQGQAMTQDLTIFTAFFFEPGKNAAPNLVSDPNLIKWLAAAQDAIVAASADQVDKVVRAQLDNLRTVQISPTAKAVIADFERHADSYLEDRGRLLKEVANAPIVAFEYTNNRPGNQPNYSNFNVIGEFSPFNGQADLTANASFSTFSTKPAGVTRTVRDFQLSGQLDVPLGDIAKTGPFIFTMSGKYQHVFSDITTTGTTPTTLKKGDLGIGQLKFTIPVKGSGVKVPLSVTFSNRTEFIKESKIRGNIGVTFDLDTIFSKIKP
jgi:hypothetical protein